MKTFFVLILSINFAYANCNFTYVNKSSHPVTLQGYYLSDGDILAGNEWVTITPNSKFLQARKGAACNDSYNYGNKDITQVVFKNHSGYWSVNKTAFSITDRALPHTLDDSDAGVLALADDRSLVALSHDTPVSGENFKVVICDPLKMDEDCQ